MSTVELKREIVLTLLAIVLIAAGPVRAQDDSTGLILHYSFEDVSGTLVGDDSGNGNSGTLRGGTALADGFEGQGVTCMAKADYIEAPDDINVGLASFTFATWVKFSALKNATRFFDWGNGIDGTHNFLIFVPSFNSDDGYMTLRYRPSSGTAYNVTSTSKCPTGTWAHVAVTFDWNGSSGTATIYLNGEPVGSGSGLPYNPSTSLGSTADNYFGYSRWAQDVNGFNGTFDDIRIYNRALIGEDILALVGLGELFEQYELLDLGDISSLTDDITLPTVLGDQGVTASWKSSNYLIIDASGNVTRPEKYDRSVELLAYVSWEMNGVLYTREKSFVARVRGLVDLPEHICRWNFDASSTEYDGTTVRVRDKTPAGLTGTLMNDAVIRTIGSTSRYNVLYLGSGSGYFDMGTEIGEAIYSLEDHTIMCYFRVDADYAELSSPGNFLYTFSNTPRGDVEQTGYLIGRLNVTGHQCTKYYWGDGKEEVAVGSEAGKGAWHHYAYVQEGDTGSIYIDGALAAQGTMTQLPSVDIALPARAGTIYNWLGRSIGLPSDVYLRKTMIFDFNVYSIALSASDLAVDHAVGDTIALLNSAYAENPDYKSPELLAEYNDLDPGDLSAVTANLDLPTQGSTYPEVSITWTSTKAEIIDPSGTVNRPDYFDYSVTLTATLELGLQTMAKSFPATVLANEGTPFSDDLLVRFDFSNLEGSTVRDVAEKQFAGTLVNPASVVTIGTSSTGIYNVLDLGQSSGHFDMGTEVGKVIPRLDDYTMAAYYRVDDSYGGLSNAGNFLWNFSNSDNILADRNGYIAGSLSKQSINTTPGYYTEASGYQSISFSRPSLKGNWHHLAYTQEGSTGTLYIDGMPVVSATITNHPSSSLIKDGTMPGTPFNWIGRSCITTDAYLRSTLVYDFRVYGRALSGEEILRTELNVPETIASLEAAFNAYIADSKTHETAIIEKPERDNPSFLEIVFQDHSPARVALNKIEKMTFTGTETYLTFSGDTTGIYLTDEILKMVFTGEGTPVHPVPQNSGLEIYPNPATDHIVLRNIEEGSRQIRIYSVTGQLVEARMVKSPIARIDISRLPRGIYIVKAGCRTVKFSKR